MRTFILLCCTTVLGFSNNTLFSQDSKVTIDSDKTVTIFEVFELIGKQTECTFIYQSDIFNDVPDIHLKSGVIKVMTLLSQCLPVRNFEVSSDKDNLITISRKPSNNSPLQDIELKGVIKESNGLPLAGVTIIVKGTNRGTTSDFDGNYVISANPDDILIISHLGYTTLTIPIQNRSTINIILKEDATALGEVQINAGYYTTTDREKTGSIARITAKEIEGQPVNNALEALQGRVTGLDIVPTTGLPGGGYAVNIRGQNSIAAGNDPFYVVDGVPFDTGSLSNNVMSGRVLPRGKINPLNTLDPASIESLEVLKDADATAIYGSRGANGVILITTKKGKAGKTTVSLDVSNTLISVTKMMDLLHTDAYLAMRREGYANDVISQYPDTAYDVNGTWDPNRDKDWQKEFIGNPAHNHAMNAFISGGTNRTRFSLGGSFMKETTVFPMDFNYKKLTVYNSLTHSSENDKLYLQFSANYGLDQNFLPTTDLTAKAAQLAPNAPTLYDTDGNLNWENSTWDNPFAELESTYHNKSKNLMVNTSIRYKISTSLEAKVNMGYNESYLSENQINPHTKYNPAYGLNSSASNAYKNDGERNSWIIEPQLNTTQQIGKGKLQLTAGATFQEENMEKFGLYAFDFPNNSVLNNLSAAKNLRILNEESMQYRYQAIYARINYNWNKKYILNLTGRRDGSSRFSTVNQFANFGAIGASWILTEEPFTRKIPWLNFAKLRASLGATGNDQIGDYQYLNTYTVGSGNYNGNISLTPSHLFNPQYAWERNRKLEIAAEASLFKKRVSLEVAYYNNRASNQLLGIPLPGTTGFNSINANLNATVENSGFEVSLNILNIQNQNFKWESWIQLSIPRNKLISFEGLENSTYVNRLVIGKPIHIIKTLNLIGVNPQTGIFEFKDYNGDGIITSPEDEQYTTDLSPKFYGSISNSFKYKSWDLSLLFQFNRKNGYNALYGTDYPGRFSQTNGQVLDHWRNSGDKVPMQMFTSGGNSEAVSAYYDFQYSNGVISDASFIRLKTVSLSYKLPLRESSALGCIIYAQAQNIWTLTKLKGVDPEQFSGFMPAVKRMALGVRLQF